MNKTYDPKEIFEQDFDEDELLDDFFLDEDYDFEEEDDDIFVEEDKDWIA